MGGHPPSERPSRTLQVANDCPRCTHRLRRAASRNVVIPATTSNLSSFMVDRVSCESVEQAELRSVPPAPPNSPGSFDYIQRCRLCLTIYVKSSASSGLRASMPACFCTDRLRPHLPVYFAFASLFMEECVPLTVEGLDWLPDSVALYAVLPTTSGIPARHMIAALRVTIYVTAATHAVSRLRRFRLRP
jgi:hypothetical protein